MWITSVREIHSDPLQDQLIGFNIDSPKRAEQLDNKSILISGWILGTKRRVEHVEVVLNDSTRKIPIRTARPDVARGHPSLAWASHCGFHHALPADLTSGSATLTISAKIGPDVIRICRITLETKFDGVSISPVFSPIMVTSLGRTGTTFSLSALGSHPEIAITRIHPFEINMAQELMQHMLDCLPLKKLSNLPRELKSSVQSDYEKRTVRYFVESIDRYYDAIARENRQTHAHYFAEKFLPSKLQKWFYEFYPNSKEIFLVRDFRDVVCSILSFNRKRGFDDFQRQNFESDLDYIRNFGGPGALLKAWKRRQDSALLVRYEDLILEGPKTWFSIFDYLNIEASPKLVSRISALCEKSSKAVKKHSTSASREESVGRWQQDLPVELAEVASETFETALTNFGYQL